MADYIERKALLRSLIELGYTTCDKWNGIRDVILTEDSADVVPVVHGRWIECDHVKYDGHSECIHYPKAAWKCSNCCNAFKKELLWKDNYCPNCGARMDGE